MNIYKNCTCEYCVFVRDEEDDQRNAEEYMVWEHVSKKIFPKNLKKNDKVQWYYVKDEDAFMALFYCQKSYDNYVFEENRIKQFAKHTYTGTIKSIHKWGIVLDENDTKWKPYDCKFVQCARMFMHKI